MTDGPLLIRFIAPRRNPCGVTDYSNQLQDALESLGHKVIRQSPDESLNTPCRADITHIQHQYSFYGGLRPWENTFPNLLSRLPGPVVVTMHEFVDSVGQGWKSPLFAKTNRDTWINHRIGGIIVHTKNDMSRLQLIGADTNNIYLIRHPVPDLNRYQTGTHHGESSSVSRLPSQDFLLVMFGFLSRKKNHLLALDALGLLPKQFKLLIAGGTHPDDRSDYHNEIAVRTRAQDIDGRVEVTGYLSLELAAERVSQGNLALLPFSETSGSGSMAFALSLGLPILASDIPPHREFQEEDREAITLFAPLTAKALARSILSLHDDPDQIQSMREGARDYALCHDYVHAAQQTVKVYREIISRRHA